MKKLLIGVTVAFFLLSFQEPLSFIERAMTHFEVIAKLVPQEKVYLHTDKSAYLTGEKIWFRGYLLNASTHRPNVYSNFIYVELIDKQNTLVHRVKSARIDSCFYGQLVIPENVQQGEYSLTAYTYRMQNHAPDFFFRKKIRIVNPKDSRVKSEVSYRKEGAKQIVADIRLTDLKGASIPATSVQYGEEGETDPSKQKSARTDREGRFRIKLDTSARNFRLSFPSNYPFPFVRNFAVPKLSDDFDVQFFPEGGALLANTRQQVAFKAIGSDGSAIAVTCSVYMDTLLVARAESEHDGMGSFRMPVSPDLPCHVLVQTQDGREKRFELPRPTGYGFGLSVRQNDTALVYQVLFAKEQKLSKPLYLLAHCRGQLIAAIPFTEAKGKFSPDIFPEGINHLVLVDEEGEIYSQRLFFKERSTEPVVTVAPNRKTYTVRDRVELTIDPESDSAGMSGTCSLAVTDDSQVAGDPLENHILSSLLLTSDLKGHIENPGYYFQERTPAISRHLDLLMMTHGWSRFDVSEIVRGAFPPQPFAYESGQVISGSVKGYVSRKHTGSGVMLMSNTGIVQYLDLDEKGNFWIQDILFPDSTKFTINALKAEGTKVRKNVVLTIDPDIFPPARYLFPYRNDEKQQEEAFFEKFGQSYYYVNGTKVFVLDEVVVREKRTVSVYETFADYSLDSARIAQSGWNSIGDVIETSFPAITVSINDDGEEILEYNGKPMLFLLNEFPEPYRKAANLRLNVIKNIYLLQPDRARMLYGPAGENGALVLEIDPFDALKKSPPTHRLLFSPLGFQKPDAFYVPKYDVDSIRFDNRYDERTTIFWEPVIRLHPGTPSRLSFYTADAPGSYTVTLEGITASGQPFRKKVKLQVK
ncbi:MAG: hypothetical protein LBR65_07885 [Culturomica sp.]|nr:hypothetical protein [Culturomica sp.]